MLQDNKNLSQAPSNSGSIFITLPINLLSCGLLNGGKSLTNPISPPSHLCLLL
jgi:hypothetical protein